MSETKTILPNTSENSILLPTEVDAKQPYSQEIWKAYSASGAVVWKKPKTWSNCWEKYKMVGVFNGKDMPLDKFKYPLIEDLKERIEDGHGIAYACKHQANGTEITDKVYEICPSINWKKYKVYRVYNFIGLRSDAFGAPAYYNLPNNVASKNWVLNFSNTTEDGEQEYYYVDAFFSSTNVGNVTFRFGPKDYLISINGLFHGNNGTVDVKAEDLDGQPLVSEDRAGRVRGVAPWTVENCFKRFRGRLLSTAWINWNNVHSAGQFCSENWSITKIDSFNNVGFGVEAQGNIFTIGYQAGNRVHPNYGRNNWSFLHNNAIEEFGPVINARYLGAARAIFDSPRLKRVRIQALNNGDWDFSNCTALDADSINYMLSNVWDLAGKFELYDDSNKAQIVNRTLTLASSFTITVPEIWRDRMSPDALAIAKRRGWTVKIGEEVIN